MSSGLDRSERTTTAARIASGGKLNLLVVDDLPEKLMALEAILEGLGQNVVCVRSGAEALRECLHRYDSRSSCSTSTCPAMDGYETAALIRQRLLRSTRRSSS